MTRFLYLSGWGTGTASVKAASLEARLGARGAALARLDLRVPSFEEMRVEAMVGVAEAAAQAGPGQVVLIGTSLGGLVAALVAERLREVAALVLYAPALDFPAFSERRPWLSGAWRALGRLPVRDKTERRLRWVGVGMLDELSTLDRWPPAPRVPTLIVHGRRDRMAPVGASRRLAAVSPTVRLLEVDDGHHLRRVWPEALLATERFLSPWLRCEPSDENEAQAEPHAR